MAHYAVYHINILESRQTAINIAEESAEPIKQSSPEYYNKILDSVLFGKFNVNTTKNNQIISLECSVVRKDEDVIVLLLCNEKSRSYDEKKSKEELIHHPGCYIIIDNRSGKSQLAIESNEAFNRNPDRVRDIIQDAINVRLREHQLEVDIRARLIPEGFWESIDIQRNQGDTIRKVVFDFPDVKRVKNLNAPVQIRERIALLQSFAEMTKAIKGSLKLEASKEDALRFEQTQEDIAQMVYLCCNTGYGLAVSFKEYGLYRFGTDIRQYGNLKEETVKEFISGTTSLGNDNGASFYLLHWLDLLTQASTNFKYEEITPKKRKRSSKK